MGEGANKIYSVTMFFHKQKKGDYMTLQRYKISFQVFSFILTQGEIIFLYLQGDLQSSFYYINTIEKTRAFYLNTFLLQKF